MCSNFEVQKVICAANSRVDERQAQIQDDQNRLVRSEVIPHPNARTEGSFQVKTFRKINANRRQKQNLDGVYKLFAPRITVGKVSPTTSVNKQTNKAEVSVRNSDIQKTSAYQQKLNTQIVVPQNQRKIVWAQNSQPQERLAKKI